MTVTVPGACDGGLLPARPLAAQAHALHAAAGFIAHAGIPGLSLTIDDERITIQVPVTGGPGQPGSRGRPAGRRRGRPRGP